MKVSIDMSPEYREPYAIIRTDKMTEEIQRIADLLGGTGIPVAAVKNSGDIAILQNSEIQICDSEHAAYRQSRNRFFRRDTSENEKRLQRIYFKKISEGFQEASRAVKHGIGL